MSPLLKSLSNDHHNFAALLEIMAREVGKLKGNEAPDFEIIELILGYLRRYGDLCHHPLENLIYRHLRESRSAAADSSRRIQAEHKDIAERTEDLLARVRRFQAGEERPDEAFVDATRNFLVGYHAHMSAEDKFLFAAAEESLSKEDWSSIEAQLAAAIDPALTRNVQERFLALRDYIHRLGRLD